LRYLLAIAVLLTFSMPLAAQSDAGNQETSPDSSAIEPSASEGFLGRFIQAYRQDWNGTGDGSESPRRIPPPPLTSPPFPSADWNYGGSSVIGASGLTSYPLMLALYDGPEGAEWKASRVQMYGWVNPGFNFSTSKHSNLPEGIQHFPEPDRS